MTTRRCRRAKIKQPRPLRRDLDRGGSDLDRIQAASGVDLAMLVSCDQFQSAVNTRVSWTYWTVVGAYVEARERGFDRAVDQLMGKLDLALVAFQTQVVSGTMHGPGTPNLGMFDRLGHPVPLR